MDRYINQRKAYLVCDGWEKICRLKIKSIFLSFNTKSSLDTFRLFIKVSQAVGIKHLFREIYFSSGIVLELEQLA